MQATRVPYDLGQSLWLDNITRDLLIGAGKRPKIMIEGFVFLEDHENIFYRRAKVFDRLFPGKSRLVALRPIPVKWQHVRCRIGLQGHKLGVRLLRHSLH
jgi:hypothetical protein